MKKNNLKILIIAALILACGALTISYAALSQVLEITDKPLISNNDAVWKNTIENVSNGEIVGSANIGDVVVQDSTVLLQNVIFKEPGSSISYTFDIVNSGNIEAKISLVQKLNPVITGSGSAKLEDEKLVREHYEYAVTYKDGSPILVGDVLKPGASQSFKITASYKASAQVLPVNEVVITGLGIVIYYEQA